ncbi:hypothetical protein PV327_005010 [Microctonus hyperodae]|uniref:Ig-like domain-containing protein n=1 Tax=Microctonus hyperodae TaxID=165561 RepID=A0AA39FDN1_MICHY|nr:hypothetical protein PV327_005010 [Microctonus hyperodae]
MQLQLRKSLTTVIALSLLAQSTVGNYINFADSLRPEESNEDIYDSDFGDTNLIADYPFVLPSTKLEKNKEWMNVTMSQGLHLLMRGQSYELKCEAAGKPAPEIYWIRGVEIKKQVNKLRHSTRTYYSCNRQEPDMAKVESKYIINCASDTNAGPIHCVAISGRFVEIKSAIIKIDGSSLREGSCNIQQSPIITKFRPTLLSVQGSTIILPCDAWGNPRPQIFWQIRGDTGATDLENDSRIKLLKDGGLLIKSLQWNDLGEYICIANSSLGEDRAMTFVYPLQSSIQ